MVTVSKEDNTSQAEGPESGYVTDNSADLMPLVGHLVQFHFRNTSTGSQVMDYSAVVNYVTGNCEGADVDESLIHILSAERKYLPLPKFGRTAYTQAIRSLRSSYVTGVQSPDWDGGSCREKWITERLGGSTIALIRVRTGHRDGAEDIEHMNVAKVRYNRLPSLQARAKTYRNAYVKSTWGEPLTDVELEAITNFDRIMDEAVVVEPYDEHSIDTMAIMNATQLIRGGYRSVCHSVITETMRRTFSLALDRLHAIPTNMRAQRFVPDLDNDRAYLPTLEFWTSLVNWFARSGRFTDESDGVTDATEISNTRVLGYIDDARQIQYLREDITTYIDKVMTKQQEDIVKTVEKIADKMAEEGDTPAGEIDNEIAEILDRYEIRSRVARRKVKPYFDSQYLGTIGMEEPEGEIVQDALRARIASLGGDTSNQGLKGRIDNLVNFLDVEDNEDDTDEVEQDEADEGDAFEGLGSLFN